MKNDTKTTCKNCAFSDATGNPAQLLCRINPPKAFAFPAADMAGGTQLAVQGIFPTVAPSEWCGEFTDPDADQKSMDALSEILKHGKDQSN